MGGKKMKVPKFKTEEEEAKWWYENREAVGEDFAQAMREGKTSRGSGLSPSQRVEAMRAKAVNIRLPETDLQLARELAEKKGLPYQTYVKSLLHEALQREAIGSGVTAPKRVD
jgi:predicted DNA binding CopG/RHH family protein